MGDKIVKEKEDAPFVSKGLGYALCGSFAYAVVGVCLIWYRTNEIIHQGTFLNISGLGDFMAGWFAPLAFMWFAGTVFIQSRELKAQKDELVLSREAYQAQVKEMESMVLQGHIKMINEMVEKYEAETFDKSHPSHMNNATRLNKNLKGAVDRIAKLSNEKIVLPHCEKTLCEIATALDCSVEREPTLIFFLMKEANSFRSIIDRLKWQHNPTIRGYEYSLIDDGYGYGHEYYSSFMDSFNDVFKFVENLKTLTSPTIVEINFASSNFGKAYKNLLDCKEAAEKFGTYVNVYANGNEMVVVGGEPVVVTVGDDESELRGQIRN